MNEREKNLILILVGAAFVIANLFGYTTYSSALQKKEVQLKKGKSELDMKRRQLEEAYERNDEIEWLAQNRPAKGTHASIRAELVTFTEQAAIKHRLNVKKRPSALRANPEEVGAFRSSVVKVVVNCEDAQLYKWLCELQDPKKSRSITRLRITPQRDDATRIDCELEVTRWYTPISEEEEEATAAN